MLINIDEDNYSYGNDCIHCHDPNETPEHKYVSFTNIIRGDLWIPADGTPPNGIYKLSQVGPCHWLVVSGPWTVSYSSGAALTLVVLSRVGPINAFRNLSGPGCQITLPNGLVNPVIEHFYNGEVQCSWLPPPSNFALHELCELLNIPTDGLTDCLLYPVLPSSRVVNMLRGTHQTKILIKQDFA